MNRRIIVAASLLLAVASFQAAAQCLGECVGNGNARDGQECFKDADAKTLEKVVATIARNGTACTQGQRILGVQIVSTPDKCKRVDLYFCESAISGLGENVRVDREPAECFSAAETANPRYVMHTIRRNGTACPASAPTMQGVKLSKKGTCWRAPSVYCGAAAAKN